MPTFKRVHESGTEAIINQDGNGCHVRLDVREPNHPPSTIVGFFAPSLDAAMQLGDEEIVKLGHVCMASAIDGCSFERCQQNAKKRRSSSCSDRPQQQSQLYPGEHLLL